MTVIEKQRQISEKKESLPLLLINYFFILLKSILDLPKLK
jgi:hypothetical protein